MQKGADKLGYESEAFAIYDTMKYIKPEVHTLCIGNAFGESAMLLSAGTAVRCRLSTAVSARACVFYPHAGQGRPWVSLYHAHTTWDMHIRHLLTARGTHRPS